MAGLLQHINYPEDLKRLGIEQLNTVCKELRERIIQETANNPGHFGASLGVVELTVALHYVLNTPYDRIVWDVGHQAYGHKLLTGRKDRFHTNRKYKGLCGFPSPDESEYDTFAVGHSSTSISAALGMAIAAREKGEDNRRVVAVIGDGSMTGGMAFEALNHAGIENSNLLVILNDNNIAIDANVGALNQYLLDITTSHAYNKLKDEVWNILGKLSRFGPNTQTLAQKIENGIKSIILKESNLFESMNFRYFGPVDGHDVAHMIQILEDLDKIKGPKLLHIKTQKGKGFANAELEQTLWHAPGKFDPETGEIIVVQYTGPKPPKFQNVFGETLLELARKNDKIVGITPAMASGCSLDIMMKEMPHRTFDVGIAEQHAVTFSAGMAKDGLIPFCNIYSTFMQRAYDQVIHDTALQKLNVIFCLDRGGLVGADGATHHGVFDIAFMRAIPNMIVCAPINERELRNIMFTAQKGIGPISIRYPRGNGTLIEWQTPFEDIQIGKGQKISDGKDIAILSLGNPGNFVIAAIATLKTEGIQPAHYDLRFAKPLDEEMLHEVFTTYKKIITVEDGVLMGGVGTAILEFMADNNYSAQVKRLGVPDKFITHGTQDELWHECGYDVDGIIAIVRELAK